MKALKLLLSLLLLSWGLSSCQAKTISGKVVRVSDGDTIVVLQNNREFKIRLDGIDCPERGQAFGNKARQFTSDQVYSKNVKVVWKNKDQYGRYLGTVFYGGGKNLGHELLKAGFAWHYKYYSKDQTLAKLETVARKRRVGLWTENNPLPPWTFRRKR